MFSSKMTKKNNKKASIILFVYGLLILGGGVMGHWKAGSLASLLSGLGFGTILIGSALLCWKEKKVGFYLGLIFTFVLDAFFTYRHIVTGKFMPAGLLEMISFLVLVLLTLQFSLRAKEAR